MWITDHQMNLEAAERFGTTRPTVPLISSPHIVCGNALRINWNNVLSAEQCSYVMGNPPFVGHQWRNEEQVEDMGLIWGSSGRFGRLDYVACWYKKSADYSDANNKIRFALVSTNSIVQGEQVGILWAYLLSKNIYINFAHQSFQWSNEGIGVATVQCVIIGFSRQQNSDKKIYTYISGVKGEPTCISAKNINPYLIDAPNTVLPSRIERFDSRPEMTKGSQPTDGGHLILSSSEVEEFKLAYPALAGYVKEFIGGEELLNGTKRYCLWLKDASPETLKNNHFIRDKLAKVASARLQSKTKSVQDFSSKPYLFTQDRQPTSDYMAMPRVSSERRRYIPIAYLSKDIIAHEKLIILLNAKHVHFALLNSSLHNAWMKIVSGRLESRYSYSPFVYYNFPLPINLSAATVQLLDKMAHGILDARALYPNSSLADLYDPLTMPTELLKAHEANNKVVDKAYGYKGADDDASRVAFLFKLYEKRTSLLPKNPSKKLKSK